MSDDASHAKRISFTDIAVCMYAVPTFEVLRCFMLNLAPATELTIRSTSFISQFIFSYTLKSDTEVSGNLVPMKEAQIRRQEVRKNYQYRTGLPTSME